MNTRFQISTQIHTHTHDLIRQAGQITPLYHELWVPIIPFLLCSNIPDFVIQGSLRDLSPCAVSLP